MTNFDIFKNEKRFDLFVDVAISAERIIHIDHEACIINCRRSLEFAIKWMYSVDKSLVTPYQDTLAALMNTDEFRKLIDIDLYKRLDYIRRAGNIVAHKGKKVSFDQASLCLNNLYCFLDYISFCYSDKYVDKQYDEALLEQADQGNVKIPEDKFCELDTLKRKNAGLADNLTARRVEQQTSYVAKPLDLSEYKTRKIYIDTLLMDVGWIEGKNWIDEYEIPGMPNKSEVGFADYVLLDDTYVPLAIIEAKKTCVDVSKGRQQAKLYADLIEDKYHRRPVVYLSNGFDTRIIDGQYPERKVAAFYSKRDLEKFFNLKTMRQPLDRVTVDKEIAGRYYQEAAIKSVCTAFDKNNRRKALLVMATGSGKTRTVIALCDILLKAGWVKNILFLADRSSLVTQAKRNFVNLLPDLSVSNLVEDKQNYNAHCIFSTYQTMINVIDTTTDDEGKIYTSGHFDLVICDEAHRSIYNKYRDIFNYFDAPLVGLTATPKDEIDKNTYEIFELESGVPTYGYELSQAVKDGYLVDFQSVETVLKFVDQGIVYDELSEEDKEAYEDTFEDEDGEVPKGIESSALNTWVFNDDTIRKVLDTLMTQGIKIDYGEKIGKTIIFAKNHKHAEHILEVLNKEYPHLRGYANVIDNQINYAQTAIDDFSDPQKLPQIAISVDMLDTGIDVPEILNLVFFKKVLSKAKFWQMIGRGTRLCPQLIDGTDKSKFYIFDFCGNFEFFRMNSGKPTANMVALQGAIFGLELEMAYKLQDLNYQTDELKAYRIKLVEDMVSKVRQIPRDNFSVRQHIKYVDMYAHAENYNALTFPDVREAKAELEALILPDKDDITAVRFDALMYGIELAYLAGKKYPKARKDLMKKVYEVSMVSNIPEIQARTELIRQILDTSYLDTAGINDFEHIREELRDLIKYIPKSNVTYDTSLTDEILSSDMHDSDLGSDELVNYKAKVEHYIRQHEDDVIIHKLKTNKPLEHNDIVALEHILWDELGSKEDYEAEYSKKPLGELVREIVGLDMNAAKEAFSIYLNDTSLDERQIYFINQIIEYIVQNGVMKDMSVMTETPFVDRGSCADVFDDIRTWNGIQKVINTINSNAVA